MGWLWLCSCSLLFWTMPAWGLSLRDIRQSIFKINVVRQEPQFNNPWLHGGAGSVSGTGFYIGDGRILTNAHVVAHGKFISVLKDGADRPATAAVKFIAHDCDLAILEVSDPDYLDGVASLRLGRLPRLKQMVSTIGYPLGGDQLSITQGIVSRISYRRYSHSGASSHLLVQVDSAINSGNSGGPVLQGDRVAGVAFQAYTDAENTGYIIPTVVVQRFLKDVEDGSYDGHPDEGLIVQEDILENEATRHFHGMKPGQSGVTVVAVRPYAFTHGEIQSQDVLLAVQGQEIGFDGKVNFQGERVSFKVIPDLAQVGDVIDFKILRQGKVIKVPVKVARAKPHPHLMQVFPQHPKYYSIAGLVFTTLTRDYLKVWGKYWYRSAPLLLRYLHWYNGAEQAFDGVKDIVVLVKRLPHEVNSYAAGYEERVLLKVNGVAVKSLEDVERLTAQDSPYLAFDFLGHYAPLVLPRGQALEANAVINQRYGIIPEKWFADPAEKDGAVGGF